MAQTYSMAPVKFLIKSQASQTNAWAWMEEMAKSLNRGPISLEFL